MYIFSQDRRYDRSKIEKIPAPLSLSQIYQITNEQIASDHRKLLAHEDFVGIAIIKKFGLFNIDFFSKLRIEKGCNSITLVKMKVFIYSNCKKSFICC